MDATNNTDKNQQLLKAVVNALRVKKEMKSRLQKGEDPRKVAEEKGYKIVLPL